MIKVIVGTTTERIDREYAPSTTIRTILEDNAIDYSVAQVMLDSVSLKTGEMDKTLAQMGITEKCMLMAVVKANNA